MNYTQNSAQLVAPSMHVVPTIVINLQRLTDKLGQ